MADDHWMQGPLQCGSAVQSRWSVGCPCGWKTIVPGKKREAKAAWKTHLLSVQRTVPFQPAP
jgi:hypothetical protein